VLAADSATLIMGLQPGLSEGVNMSQRSSTILLLFSFFAGSAWVHGQTDITGTVALADGSPVGVPVRVQLKCRGSVVQSVMTGPNGRFTFKGSAGGFDASVGGPSIPLPTNPGNVAFRRTDLSQCQCEASLAGYESNPVRLGVRSRFDNPDVGVIHLFPIGSVKGTTISANIAKAPKKAMDAFKKAQKELTKEKVDYSKVAKNLQKALEIYPEFAEAWQFLGETRLMEEKETEARDAFRRAIEADPRYLPPYATLGELELRANHIEEAAQLTGRAIELNPFDVGSQYLHAIAQYYLGETGKAEQSIQRVQESSEAERYPASHRLLGSIYSERGEYAAAAEQFQRFLKTGPPENEAEEVRKILDEWTKSGLI